MLTKTSKSAAMIMILTVLGFGLGYINIFFVLPRFLTKEEIGVYRVLFDLVFIIFPLLQLGGVNILNKYFFHETEKGKGSLIGFTITVFFAFTVLFMILFLAFKRQILGAVGLNTGLIGGIEWCVISLVIIIGLVNLIGSHLRNYNELAAFNIYNSFYLRVVAMIAFIGYGIKMYSYEQANYYMVFLLAAGLIILWLFSIRKTGVVIKPERFKGQTPRRDLLNYGGIMLLGYGSTLIITKIDTVMTGGIIGPEFAGVYSIALALSSIIEVPRRSISQVLIPQVSERFSKDDFGQIHKIYINSSLSLFFLSTFLFCGLIGNLDDFLQLIPNSRDYVSGKNVVIILALAKVFDAFWGINSEILILSKFYRWNMYLMVVLLVLTVGLNFIFINDELLITGTAIATGLTVLLYNILRGAVLYFKYKMLPFSINHIKIMVVMIIAYLPVWFEWLDFSNIWLSMTVKSLWIGMVYLLALMKLNISPEIDNFKKLLIAKIPFLDRVV